MNTIGKYYKALICLFIIATTAAMLGSESPSVTSTFFCTVSVDGHAVPDGTAVSASVTR